MAEVFKKVFQPFGYFEVNWAQIFRAAGVADEGPDNHLERPPNGFWVLQILRQTNRGLKLIETERFDGDSFTQL